MSDLNKLAAVQAVVSSFMTDVKDILKISIAGYAEILSLIPEEKRTEVVLAVIAANTADTAAAERITTKVIDAAAVVIPAMATARMEVSAAAERAALDARTAAREAAEERDALACMRQANDEAAETPTIRERLAAARRHAEATEKLKYGFYGGIE